MTDRHCSPREWLAAPSLKFSLNSRRATTDESVKFKIEQIISYGRDARNWSELFKIQLDK